MKQLTKPRYEALLYRRLPFAKVITPEIEWWSSDDEKVIGAVNFDRTDDDYSFILLGRDETGVFRGIDLNVSIPTRDEARSALHVSIDRHSIDGFDSYPQGDNNARKQEILVPCVPREKLHTNFLHLTESSTYSPACGLLKELSFAFKDKDGNFRKDFQTTGFDGRLWELYLYATFYEAGFEIDDSKSVPDFILSSGEMKFVVEAVTVNPSKDVVAPKPVTHLESLELRRDYMPIKWGSPLTSKLKKEYWKKAHLQGLPFVIAIHDYHAVGSMVWSLPALSDYLYAIRCDENGVDCPVERHSYKEKEIPSGFFKLPGSENVSAILASNSATLPKFNRMGKIAGFGDSNIQMNRFGFLFDAANSRCIEFREQTEVGRVDETWSSNLWVFHNPRALYPIRKDIFPNALHVFLVDGQRHYCSCERFHVLSSVTQFDVVTA